MNVYLYRHGETHFNTKGIVQGRGVDSSLNETGKQQAAAFFDSYKDVKFNLIITSTLKRTIETVEPFEQLNIPIERRTELDEIGWGIYEGKPVNKEMRSAYLGLIRSWGEGNYTNCLQNGDSALQMGERLGSFAGYLKTLKCDDILICTHGGCMAFLLAILQDQPLSEMINYKHQNTGLCLFNFDGNKFHLRIQDDISHLDKIKNHKII
ncbi:MAG: histidine phosphatase family protein [Saprospiraceae bacterium]|nr:histidine phosphatase family protein [Saprospiraceae bacterium]